MRTAAFPKFRKLYGRILIEENSKLADKISDVNKTMDRILKIKNELFSKLNDTSILGIEFVKKPISKYRLPRGQYYVEIDYSNLNNFFSSLLDFQKIENLILIKGYMVTQFGGKKYFVLTNVSWIGGKCNFLAIAYIVVGCLCFVTSLVLFLVHVYFGQM